MINLLPPDVKDSYRYARRNVHLLHWAFAIGFAFVGLIILSVGGLWYLKQTTSEYNQQVAIAEQNLQEQDQAAVEKQVQDISSSLKLAVQVLSKQVVFSELLKQLAVITPSDARLANLTISQVQGALDISANTADYNAATQLQVNLADPANRIFTKADIVSITCTPSTTANDSIQSRYPCTVSIRALFASDNPFLFIKGSSAKPANQPSTTTQVMP